jgi:hypothetical protein
MMYTVRTNAANLSTSATRFIGVIEGSATTAATSGEVEQLAPSACTASSLRARAGSSIAVGESVTITLIVNGSSTSVTCALTDTANPCSDLINTASIAAGDRLAVQLTGSNGAPATVDVLVGFICQ